MANKTDGYQKPPNLPIIRGKCLIEVLFPDTVAKIKMAEMALNFIILHDEFMF